MRNRATNSSIQMDPMFAMMLPLKDSAVLPVTKSNNSSAQVSTRHEIKNKYNSNNIYIWQRDI